jgi:hypothetical protein
MRTYRTGEVVQVAYAVSDVRAAAAELAGKIGAGPFFARRHPLPRSVRHRDGTGEFDHSSAYGQWGTVQVELVEIHHASPTSLADVVMASSGIHHVAWFVASIDEEERRLAALGWPQVMRAETATGFPYAFHDARAELGHLVEIYEPADGVIALYRKVAAAAEGWAGDQPVREL